MTLSNPRDRLDRLDRLDAEARDLDLAILDAMENAAADELAVMLADDYTLTHMTGYVQPKAEWLDEIRSRTMEYHSVTVVDCAAEHVGDHVVLTTRTHTDATIWGGRGTWRLRLRTRYRMVGDALLAIDTVASVW